MSDNTFKVWRLRHYFPILMLVTVLLIFSLGGEPLRLWLRYERGAILLGHEVWRLVTGHLVHAGWQHTWLNLSGLIIISVLFRHTYNVAEWLIVGLISALCIDLGLLYWMPYLQWYLGLSGVLHGVLVAGALFWWRSNNRRLASLLLIMIVCKLAWEQWQGALPLSGALNVIVNAHLYGAIGGLFSGLLLFFKSAQLHQKI